MMAGLTPGADGSQAQAGCSSQSRRIKILMGNRVSPSIQPLKVQAPITVSSVIGDYTAPKGQSKSVEIGTDVAWVRVSHIKLPVLGQRGVQNRLKSGRGHGPCEPTHSECRSRQKPWNCDDSSTA